MRTEFCKPLFGLLTVVSLSSTAIAQTTSRTGARFESSQAGTWQKPCPQSSFQRPSLGGEGLPIILGGLLTTFVDKGFDVFADWLAKRKERLSGTATARLTDDFYEQGQVKAECYIFTVGTFGQDGQPTSRDVYLEFVPRLLDESRAFTLQPVYLEYNRTTAQARSKSGKNISMALTYKFAAPAAKDEKGNISASALKDGGGFAFTFGKLLENTRLDFEALRGVDGGVAFTPPKIGATSEAPVAYEMNAMWVESDEPSPLYNAFVATIKDNKAAISPEVAKALRDILGLPDPK